MTDLIVVHSQTSSKKSISVHTSNKIQDIPFDNNTYKWNVNALQIQPKKTTGTIT